LLDRRITNHSRKRSCTIRIDSRTTRFFVIERNKQFRLVFQNHFLSIYESIGVFVNHPLIKIDSIEEREYQRTLAHACISSPTLVVLPTGLGKTVVALLVIAEVLDRRKGKVLFLAPTKPLVEQHAAFLGQNLLNKKIALMTGEKKPSERQELWAANEVIVSTPQVIANDLKNERIDLDGFALVIFDEAHRGVGKYSYVPVAEAYRSIKGMVMGMTASPGASKDKIMEVCTNLGIKNIEVRSKSDPDVVKYVHEVEIDWVKVEVPEQTKEVASILRSLFDSYVQQLVKMGCMTSKRPPTTMYLLEVNKTLQMRLHSGKNRGYMFRALSVQAMAVKVGHAIELAETQGLASLNSYMEKLRKEASSKKGSKASSAIVSSPEFKQAEVMLQGMKDEHPKIPKVMSIVSDQLRAKPDSKIMVFTNYRDSCEMVTVNLSQIDGVMVSKLIGQTKRGEDKGLRQKEQVEVLSSLKRGDINVIVATCVGEEGLDVDNTDLVVFYEPVPSAIRSIQRRGRTGRSSPGRVVVLITIDTKDVGSIYSSTRKEGAMKKHLLKIQKELDKENGSNHKPVKSSVVGQRTITDY
jgi:ERCC4-related helicase